MLAVGAAILAVALSAAPGAEARPARDQAQRENQHRPRAGQAPQAAARPQQGMASYYAPRFSTRRTAAGGRFDPNSDTAAHRTLPLGTVARVTNLANGRSAVVTIRDRGPHARGRIVDVSPRVAEDLRMRDAGVTRVILQPIAVPATGSRRRG
ncbi:septal ring lytic transglycosylase RlpA family protein [Plastoroseomonas hellenica]|uniref:septal ring lytic transglycosylase RlpA family protein n=1 Tax=Plastoroseomonas hellenica TaxID=2687306 RepID=UPI0034632102